MDFRVALIFPHRFGDVLVEPLGICQLGAYLRQQGFETRLFDTNLPNKAEESVARVMLEYNPAVIGISNPHEESATSVLHFAERLRQLGYTGIIIFGGLAVSLAPETYVKDHPEVDLAIAGEGEIAMATVLKLIREGADWRGVPGVTYVDASGTCHSNGYGQVVKDLDQLPFPARDILAEHVKVLGAKHAMAYMVQSRGCYKTCSFCSVAAIYRGAHGKVHRRRSMKSVVEEMHSIYDQFGVTRFAFEDDQFVLGGPVGLNQILEFHRLVMDLPFQPELRLACRVDLLTDEVIRLLEECGTQTIFTGVESFNEVDLALYEKGTSVEEMVAGLEALNRRGWSCQAGSNKRIEAGFIAFNPLSTVTGLRHNLSLMRHFNIPFTMLTTQLELWNGTRIKDKLYAQSQSVREGRYFEDPAIESVFLTFRDDYYFGGLRPWRKQLRNVEKFGADPDGRVRHFREGLDQQAYDVFGQLLDLAEAGLGRLEMVELVHEVARQSLTEMASLGLTQYLEELKSKGMPLTVELR
jgi:anaerobic magnesium-protoporphyrin IX monomethyl ester cyclase